VASITRLMTGVILTLASQGAVWAQSTEQTAESTGVLQEIVITAQRRTENLQTVPIAVTALQGSDLAGTPLPRCRFPIPV
jgi:iron complex outermembrane receptor protein